jgi:hypothetical protein
MKNHRSSIASRPFYPILCAGAVAAGLALNAHAQITVDGSRDAGYGGALAVQTINTGFGDSTVGDGTSSGGSELDAAYGSIQGGTLYIFLSGNFEDNGNHANIFISGGAAGQSTLNAPTTGSLQNMNGSVFSPGFQATYAYDMNNYAGTLYNEEYVYAGAGALSGGYVGAVGTSGGIGNGVPSGGGYPAFATIGMNDTHVSTMVQPAGSAANQAQAASVTTGLELGIPLSQIGYTGGSIEVLADINGGGTADTYLSDQFLPGLPVGTGNLGTSTFNFGSTPGEFFTVSPVPEPSTIALIGMGLVGFVSRRRK